MINGDVDTAGVFPLDSVVPYQAKDPDHARQLLAARSSFAGLSTWWHVTYRPMLDYVLKFGLLPSCWLGGDTCAVFGFDTFDDVPTWRRYDWLVEVHSRALPGHLKAWWVPPRAIRGVWIEGRFIPRALLLTVPRAQATISVQLKDGCDCVLSDICREQQTLWRASLS